MGIDPAGNPEVLPFLVDSTGCLALKTPDVHLDLCELMFLNPGQFGCFDEVYSNLCLRALPCQFLLAGNRSVGDFVQDEHSFDFDHQENVDLEKVYFFQMVLDRCSLCLLK